MQDLEIGTVNVKFCGLIVLTKIIVQVSTLQQIKKVLSPDFIFLNKNTML